jgi:hypothetical protein
MKRFKVITTLLSVCVFVLSVNFIAFAASPIETQSDNTPIGFHDKTCLDVMISPVFNTTGTLVSDPTGTLLNPLNAECRSVAVMGADVKISPVFDSTGALVADPTGTMLKATHSENRVIPVTGVDTKIAPVFDGTGKVVSDPTGTILSTINP